MGLADHLTRYSAACATVAASYIERSTRFNVKDVRVLDARPVSRTFSIRIRHELEVVADARDHHGRHLPGANDFATADWAWYQEQVAAQSRAEFSRPETLDSLIASVKNQAYAAISERTCIRTHPRKFFHTYTCSGCSGAGKVSCHTCSGSGKVSCGWCHGSGRTSCNSCGGSGTTTHHRTVRDHNGYTRSEMQTRSCSSCSGGRVRCSSCGGSGKKRCGTCDGTGRLTCTGCSGHGCLTKVTATHTYTRPGFSGHYPGGTPDYVHEALCKAGFANLARHGEIVLREVVEQRETSSVEFVYDCTMPFCELTVDVMGVRSEWVLFGTEPQIFDAGGVLESLLKSDFELLRATAQSGKRWLPWFHRSARRAMTPLLASEVNQEIVAADTAGLAPAAILERVNRSVSETYIQGVLNAMQHSVKIASHWSRMKWLLGFALLSIPCALLATAYLQGRESIAFSTATQQLFLQSPSPSGMLWGTGLLTIPFALIGWFFARWMSMRWLRKAGGKAAIRWADQRGLLLGKWTALTFIAASISASGAVFNRWPLWIDMEGKAYGKLALFEPPHLIEPVPQKTQTGEKKHPPKRPVKKAKTTHALHPPAEPAHAAEPVATPGPVQHDDAAYATGMPTS